MLYIHIPFCKGKCIYCDFYSGGNPDWKRYIKALFEELSARRGELKKSLSSVYLGGGTPSLMPEEIFEELIEGLRSLLPESFSNAGQLEFTIEVNPEDVTEEKIRAWKRGGVNRVSMGVQSLDDSELRFLRRRHSAGKAMEAAGLILSEIPNLSLDIIYGLPGQSEDSLKKTLGGIIDLKPKHISLYSLTYEPGTPLDLLRRQGKIKEADESLYLSMDRLIDNTLSRSGYERYEISNYALPGFESRHNSGYWCGRAYLGLGPSASSFDGEIVRRNNPANLMDYMKFYSGGNKGATFYEEEILTPEERREENIFLLLRTREGVNLELFTKEFGVRATETLLRKARKWILSGEMVQTASHLALTKKGIPISDFIILDLT